MKLLKMLPTVLSFVFILGPSFLTSREVVAAEPASAPAMDAYVDALLLPDAAMDQGLQKTHSLRGVVTNDRTDHQAQVYEVEGRVRMTKKDGQGWQDVKKGTVIEEGRVILTDKKSSASVTFDRNYSNVVRIPENTRVVFRAIEPTNMFLEDGAVYNLFAGLPPKSNWKVTTPTAVAAVRGTYYFVNYTASNGNVLAATIEVPDDGEESSIKLIDLLPNGSEGPSADIPEGYQIDLKANQSPDPSLLKTIDPKWLEQIQAFLEKLALLRAAEEGGFLPPTGGELLELGDTSPQALGAYEGAVPTLDPVLDTGSVLPPPDDFPSPDTSSSDSLPEQPDTSEHAAFHEQLDAVHEAYHEVVDNNLFEFLGDAFREELYTGDPQRDALVDAVADQLADKGLHEILDGLDIASQTRDAIHNDFHTAQENIENIILENSQLSDTIYGEAVQQFFDSAHDSGANQAVEDAHTAVHETLDATHEVFHAGETGSGDGGIDIAGDK